MWLWLGVRRLSDIAQILDPQVLVVGGGVIDAGELLLEPTRRAYLERLPQRAKLPVANVIGAVAGQHGRCRRRRGPRAALTTMSSSSRTPSVRVLTYNVHGLHDDRHALASVVREAAPDM